MTVSVWLLGTVRPPLAVSKPLTPIVPATASLQLPGVTVPMPTVP